MKPIRLFYLASCKYCRNAIAYMDELKQQAAYKDVEVEMIEESEHPDLSDAYDYYFVPSYYIDDVLVHEGAATLEEVEAVFKKAIAM